MPRQRQLSASATRKLPKITLDDIIIGSIEFIPRGTPAARPYPHRRTTRQRGK